MKYVFFQVHNYQQWLVHVFSIYGMFRLSPYALPSNAHIHTLPHPRIEISVFPVGNASMEVKMNTTSKHVRPGFISRRRSSPRLKRNILRTVHPSMFLFFLVSQAANRPPEANTTSSVHQDSPVRAATIQSWMMSSSTGLTMPRCVAMLWKVRLWPRLRRLDTVCMDWLSIHVKKNKTLFKPEGKYNLNCLTTEGRKKHNDKPRIFSKSNGLSRQASRAKEVFRKFVDSVLQKSAKIRSLTMDLKKNYHEDATAMKWPGLGNKTEHITTNLCWFWCWVLSDKFSCPLSFSALINNSPVHRPAWTSKGSWSLGGQLDHAGQWVQQAIGSHGCGWAARLLTCVSWHIEWKRACICPYTFILKRCSDMP